MRYKIGELYSVNRIAELLDTSRQTVMRIIKQNNIKVIKNGNWYFVKAYDYRKIRSYFSRSKNKKSIFRKATNNAFQNKK
ncbi:MAG: helix-turn-helix domain-containing protein [Candidatus Bilamarchaeaceae archaeon]